MANPLAWLPFHGDKRSRRAAVLGGALTFSLLIHVGLPLVNWHRVEAVSETPVTVTLLPPPPIPLPEADEPNIAPDEEDSDAPVKPDTPAQKETAPKVVKEPEPDPEPPEDEPPPEAAPPPLPKTDDAAARLAALQKQREERMAERARRRAAWLAAMEARKAQRGAGGKKGGAPLSGVWKTGKPDAVYMCGADDKGDELHVTRARPMSQWITIVPTVLAGFDTRPGIGGYLDRVQQVIGRDRTQLPRRIGFVELALPDDVLQIPLEQPRGVRIAVGRLDARCLIGFRYARNLFPFTIQRAPVRIIDAENHTVTALVDVTFYKDVSIDIRASDGSPLPFKRGRLKNGANIQRNIEDHYEAARLAKSIADLFGIKLVPKSKGQIEAERRRAELLRRQAQRKATLAEGKPPKRQQD